MSHLFDSLGRGPNGRSAASAIVTAAPAASVLAANAQPIAPPGAAQLAYFDPYERPIPGAVEFNVVGVVDAITASAALSYCGIIEPSETAGSFTVRPLFRIPPNSYARISGFTLYQQDTDETTNYWPIYYSLLLNGGAVPGYSNLPYFPRTSALLTNTYTPYIRLGFSPASIDVSVLNLGSLSIASGKLGAAVSGWYWSTASNKAWLNQFATGAP